MTTKTWFERNLDQLEQYVWKNLSYDILRYSLKFQMAIAFRNFERDIYGGLL